MEPSSDFRRVTRSQSAKKTRKSQSSVASAMPLQTAAGTAACGVARPRPRAASAARRSARSVAAAAARTLADSSAGELPQGYHEERSSESPQSGSSTSSARSSSQPEFKFTYSPSSRRRHRATSAAEVSGDGLGPRLNLAFHELKGRWAYLADNDFIRKGYRVSLSSGQALRSMFQLHNETVNVWTHLLGAIMFIALITHFFVGMEHLGVPAFTYWHPEAPRCDALVRDGQHTPLMFRAAALGGARSRCATAHQSRPLFAALHDHLAHDLTYAGEAASVLGEQLRLHMAAFRDELPSATLVGRGAAASAGKRLGRIRELLQHRVEALTAALTPHGGSDTAAAKALSSAHAALQSVDATRHSIQRTVLDITSELGLPEWPILVFLCSACFCLMSSSMFHLLHVVGPSWFDFLAKLDYAGIGVLIAGSSIPVFHYGFFCRPGLQLAYTAFITIVCGICVAIVFIDKFKEPQYRTFRMAAFVSAGLSGVFPLVHLGFIMGLENAEVRAIAGNMVIMGAMYIGGAVLYAARVPERFFPGKFDMLLSSHQIFHLFVLGAALLHYFTVVRQYNHRSANLVCDTLH